MANMKKSLSDDQLGNISGGVLYDTNGEIMLSQKEASYMTEHGLNPSQMKGANGNGLNSSKDKSGKIY